ncbi:globin domain-containing protein [Candidatus Hepatobacter penaei]|uniref:globin domain-containing protein n=1 Tax=Candidatus Hepatobacter penaei TaxID=1274402 RepID=UPI0006972C3D|nr:globin domain-containing protein [Candidatus Hepatobacter penaei]
MSKHNSASRLSERKINIVKDCAPALKGHGLSITSHMYDLMFQHHPEVFSLFNPVNNKTGEQPKSLARAMLAYAEHIDDLAALGPRINQIAHKHVSLDIKAEHYDVVGANLLKAIDDVLNPGQECLDAWQEAYAFLAQIFVQSEADIYRSVKNIPGGWEGFRPFVIDKKEKSGNTMSLYLKPKDGNALPAFCPGQYVAIKVPSNDPKRSFELRNFSLSGRSQQDHYRLTVKDRVSHDPGIPDGLVSQMAHTIEVGEVVELSPPVGDFVLKTDTQEPTILLSAGVGLTPMLSMVSDIAAHYPHMETFYIHTTQNTQSHAFKEYIEDLAQNHEHIRQFVCYTEPREGDTCDHKGQLTEDILKSVLSSNKE